MKRFQWDFFDHLCGLWMLTLYQLDSLIDYLMCCRMEVKAVMAKSLCGHICQWNTTLHNTPPRFILCMRVLGEINMPLFLDVCGRVLLFSLIQMKANSIHTQLHQLPTLNIVTMYTDNMSSYDYIRPVKMALLYGTTYTIICICINGGVGSRFTIAM